MLEKPRDAEKTPLVQFSLIAYSYLFYGSLECLAAFVNYFLYMSERGPLGILSNPLPADDNASVVFPVGYSPYQLIGAWTWGTNSNNLGADQIGNSCLY